jgi:hypothetical protein
MRAPLETNYENRAAFFESALSKQELLLTQRIQERDMLAGALEKFIDNFIWLDGPERWIECVHQGCEALAAVKGELL